MLCGLVGLKCSVKGRTSPLTHADEEYLCCAQEPEKCTVDDFEKLSDLDFALMVWRQNLKRSLGLASSRQVGDRSCRLQLHPVTAIMSECNHRSVQS